MVRRAMGDLLSYRPPQARQESTARMGMVLFLGSWAMLFGGLFFAYGMLRARAALWPPADLPSLPLLQPSINTLVIVFSSLTIQGALLAMRQGRTRMAAWALALATLLGVMFLGLQMEVWLRVYRAGLVLSAGPYPSVFYALTWFHALHVLVGLLALAVLAYRAFRGAYSAPRHLPMRLWAMYWHFVGAIWVLMFILVYLV